MTDSGNSNSSELMERVIKPVRIEVENRGGYDVLVVEDSAGNEYTTLRDDLVEKVSAEKKKYLENTWKIVWSITKEGFINFHGFVEESEEEPEKEEIDPEEFEVVKRERQGLNQTNIRITRQSAGHGATRIVSGKIASGERLSDEEIKQELQKWTDYLKEYYRSGEWK